MSRERRGYSPGMFPVDSIMPNVLVVYWSSSVKQRDWKTKNVATDNTDQHGPEKDVVMVVCLYPLSLSLSISDIRGERS